MTHEAEPEVELSLQRERARREAMSSLMRATNACVAGERTDPYADCFLQSHYMATDCPPERLPRSEVVVEVACEVVVCASTSRSCVLCALWLCCASMFNYSSHESV